jgi:tight adherence protein C
MLLLLLLALAFTGLAVVMVARLLVVGRQAPVRLQAQIEAYGFEPEPRSGESASRRLSSRVDALAATIGALLAGRMKNLSEDALKKELQAAGLYSLSARKFMGYRALATIALPLVWVWFASTTGSGPLRFIGGLLLAIAFGWQGPIVLVRRRSRTRLDEIDTQMPELIDLLVTTIEAGVAFSGSLRLAATRFHGALGQELRLALQEQEMGLSANEALSNMLFRADTPAMRSFVRSILQGETLGVSIGKIMRDLAIEMRKRRRQMAEERVQKAPTKMLFPLVFLIFPAMFVVILGPAALQIMHTLSGTG